MVVYGEQSSVSGEGGLNGVNVVFYGYVYGGYTKIEVN